MIDDLRLLMQLRQNREQRCRGKLAQCWKVVEECQTRLREAEAELQRFIDWRPAYEYQLFSALRESTATQRTLLEYYAKVETLDGQQVGLEAKVGQALEAIEQAKMAVSQAQLALQTAIKATEKFKEIVKQTEQRLAQAQVKQEESQLDEDIMTQRACQLVQAG